MKEPTLSAIVLAPHEGREPLREHWISEETLAATNACANPAVWFFLRSAEDVLRHGPTEPAGDEWIEASAPATV